MFVAALDRPEPERDAFVVEVCGDDRWLRDEVLSLLASDRDAGSFGETPAALLLGAAGPSPAGSTPRLAAGTRLGPYEVLGFLRAGGMGEVYRGRHTVLERPVAIKTVRTVADAEARRRLVREARHASLLKHRNICTVHEVGEVDGTPFIVMELVDGRPLSEVLGEGGLPLDEGLGYASGIAEALAHAHRQGIIHRDLKSSNVVIDGEGRAVVLDFGLAKRIPTPTSPATGESITAVGQLAGTLSHMAPEVLLGGAADVRSDVWALGVLLFELATGRLPFHGKTPFETSSAILDAPPDWGEQRLPMALRLVIERCLAKDPRTRYQSADEVRASLEAIRRRRAWPLVGRLLLRTRRRQLYAFAAFVAFAGTSVTAAPLASPRLGRWLTGGSGPIVTTLVLLPFQNSTGNPEIDYFAAGLSEGLLTSLGGALEVRLVSAGLGPRAEAGTGDPAAVARRLGAEAAVAGRLRMASDRIALDVRLIDAARGRVLWSDTFERSVPQVLVLQTDVVRGLAAAVKLALRPDAGDRLTLVRAVNPEAYQEYLKGRYEWNQRTPPSLERALAHFAAARDLDPTYAPAWAALADVYSQFATVLVAKGSPLVYRPQAEEAAIRALQIDPYSAEAHAALGYVRHYDLRWTEAEQSFRRALELNPSYPLAHLWLANLLMSRGRLDEALEHAHMARELDPFSLIVNANIGWILLAADRREEALQHLRWTLALDSTYLQARARLMDALVALDRLEEAREEAERLIDMSQRAPYGVARLATIHARTGRPDEAKRLLDELLDRARRGYVPPALLSEAYGALDQVEPAVEWLVRSFEERSNAVAYFILRPELGGVHADPRIQALAARRGAS